MNDNYNGRAPDAFSTKADWQQHKEMGVFLYLSLCGLLSLSVGLGSWWLIRNSF